MSAAKCFHLQATGFMSAAVCFPTVFWIMVTSAPAFMSVLSFVCCGESPIATPTKVSKDGQVKKEGPRQYGGSCGIGQRPLVLHASAESTWDAEFHVEVGYGGSHVGQRPLVLHASAEFTWDAEFHVEVGDGGFRCWAASVGASRFTSVRSPRGMQSFTSNAYRFRLEQCI